MDIAEEGLNHEDDRNFFILAAFQRRIKVGADVSEAGADNDDTVVAKIHHRIEDVRVHAGVGVEHANARVDLRVQTEVFDWTARANIVFKPCDTRIIDLAERNVV
jgi:hypothetical protein